MDELGVQSLHLENELNTLDVCSTSGLQLDLGGDISENFKNHRDQGRVERETAEDRAEGRVPRLCRWGL